jgi:hypothetical protein
VAKAHSSAFRIEKKRSCAWISMVVVGLPRLHVRALLCYTPTWMLDSRWHPPTTTVVVVDYVSHFAHTVLVFLFFLVVDSSNINTGFLCSHRHAALMDVRNHSTRITLRTPYAIIISHHLCPQFHMLPMLLVLPLSLCHRTTATTNISDLPQRPAQAPSLYICQAAAHPATIHCRVKDPAL